MIAQQMEFVLQIEGAALQDDFGVQRQRFLGWFNGAHHEARAVAVGEGAQLLTADGEKDAALCGCDEGGGTLYVRHRVPAVPFPLRPGRAAECDHGQTELGAGGLCVAADVGGEGMGCVDERVDLFVDQVGGQTGDAAESPNAHQAFGECRLADATPRARRL